MKILLTILVMIGLSLPGKTQSQSCPLQATLVKNIGPQLSLDVQNMSGKQLASYQFAVVFFDTAGRAHAFPVLLNGTTAMKPQLHRRAVWQNRLTLQYQFPLAQAYLVKAKFSDGTLWMDDGSKSCSVVSVQE
jgi:hypothetical protein